MVHLEKRRSVVIFEDGNQFVSNELRREFRVYREIALEMKEESIFTSSSFFAAPSRDTARLYVAYSRESQVHADSNAQTNSELVKVFNLGKNVESAIQTKEVSYEYEHQGGKLRSKQILVLPDFHQRSTLYWVSSASCRYPNSPSTTSGVSSRSCFSSGQYKQ